MKTVFVIQGYEKKEGNVLVDNVVFEIYAKTYNEAVATAKTLYKKPHYRLTQVIQK